MMKDESVFVITFILKCEVIYILVYLNRLNKIRNGSTRVLTIWWFNLFIRVNFFACFYKLFSLFSTFTHTGLMTGSGL